MEFEEILFLAKKNEQRGVEQLINMYMPMLIRNSLVKGVFDEDLYQELIIETLKCIRYFRKIE